MDFDHVEPNFVNLFIRPSKLSLQLLLLVWSFFGVSCQFPWWNGGWQRHTMTVDGRSLYLWKHRMGFCCQWQDWFVAEFCVPSTPDVNGRSCLTDMCRIKTWAKGPICQSAEKMYRAWLTWVCLCLWLIQRHYWVCELSECTHTGEWFFVLESDEGCCIWIFEVGGIVGEF